MKRLLVVAAVLGLTGCSRSTDPAWQGYIEAEFIRVAAPLGGTLEVLDVERGAQVATGEELFVLERAAEQATLQEATDQLRQATSRLDDLQKGLRPTEIAALEARVAQAEAAVTLAEREFARATALLAQGTVPQSDFDQAQTTRDQARQTLEAASADLATARLGGREDQIRAAEAAVAAAEAAVARARWSVDQKQCTAPVSSLVQDTFYRPGEWVAPGSPVVSLLAPDRIKVRFFIPETAVGTVRIGDAIQVSRDGVEAPLSARISYIAPQPEFTPPVIYSQETRAKLVFLVEGTFPDADPAQLHPGQPVDVRLARSIPAN